MQLRDNAVDEINNEQSDRLMMRYVKDTSFDEVIDCLKRLIIS